MYGDGSDGILDIEHGTYKLNLNQKYQFQSINIASGATLTTDNTTGSVLYLLCQGDCVINGTIDVSSDTLTRGDNTWDVTLDGTEYSSPGVADGGAGGDMMDASGGSQANGYGGGGAGGAAYLESDGTFTYGGNGGDGGPGFTNGAQVTITRASNGYTVTPGNDGSNSGGGSGAALVYREFSSGGTLSITARGGITGTGASVSWGGGAWGQHDVWVGAGGGAGGYGGVAGIAGVNVVIKAKTLTLNGTIVTAGTDGGDGGSITSYDIYDDRIGGGGYATPPATDASTGATGGGGGGGNGGNITLVYSTSISDSLTKDMSGGSGGAGYAFYGDSYGDVTDGSDGSDGADGTYSVLYSPDIRSTVAGIGTATITYEQATMDITSGATGGGAVIYLTVFQALPQKDYECRVYDHDGNFLSVWQNVISDFSYSQSINQTPSELTVELARAPDNTIVIIDVLEDSDGETITDENSDAIYVQTTTANAVGPDTDIDLNYNVDVYTFYGGYDQLLDEGGDPILDENSDSILTQYGAPNGKRVYSGYIADYQLMYGDQTGTTVTVVPHSTETSHYVFMDSESNTTVNYDSTDPVQIARDVMDNYTAQGGVVTYDDTTMPLSGESASYDFKLQTTRESIDKTIDLLPSGYYQFVDPGENVQYLLKKEDTAKHTFYYQQHVSQLTLEKSLTQLVNEVYFIGGDTGDGTDLFKFYSDSTSLSDWRPGLDRQSDSRVTLADSAEALSMQEIDEFKSPRYRTSVTISDAVYDIESIKLGETVGFKNFGTFLDTLILQIVTATRNKHTITLDLDMLVPSDTKRLYELKKQLQSELVSNIGDAPV